MTRKGSLMPRVLLASAGQVMKLVETLVPMISRTDDWMSGSVILLMWPLRTDLSQICRGLELRELDTSLTQWSKGLTGTLTGMCF